MPLEILRQSNWNAGELDPRMLGRRDLKAYYATAALIENLVTTPQGPLRRRPGTIFRDFGRGVLEAIDISGAAFTAPHGGDADAVLPDGGGFTTADAMAALNPFPIVVLDLGAQTEISLVDAIDVQATAGGEVLASLIVQTSVSGTTWRDFGPRHALGSIIRSRRFGIGPGQSRTCRYVRLAKVGAHNFTTAHVSVDEIRLWKETAEISDTKIWTFARDDDTARYFMVHSDRNIEVYQDRARVASIAVDHQSAVVRYVDRAQSLDTLLAFHADVQTPRITRQGAHGEWDWRAAAFENVPKYDFDGDHAGGVSEVQKIRFIDFVNADLFNVSFEGETTGALVYSNVGATTAAHIQAALELLSNVGVGGVVVASISADEFTVTFAQDLAFVDINELVTATVSSVAGGVFVETVTQGDGGGDPIMSAERGWPGCGAFWAQRLYLGGFLQRPQTFVASRTGDFFNLNTKGTSSITGLDFTLDTSEETTIKAIFPGQHLQFFTTTAEFFIASSPIVASPPPDMRHPPTGLGILPGTQPVLLSGATMFLTRNAGALIEFLYDNDIVTYSGTPLSVLSSHLMDGVIDLAFRASDGNLDRMDMAIMARSDGGATVMTALRTQNVAGFARWTTDGAYLAGAGDRTGEIWLAVKRTIGGADRVLIEQVSEDAMLDAQVERNGDGFSLFVDGLEHLEGLTVDLYIDDSDAGTALVTAGRAVLPRPALRKVAIGGHFEPRVRTLPGVLQQDQRSGAAMGARVGEIGVRLGPSVGLKGGLVGGRQWTFPLKRRPTVIADQGDGVDPFTGWTRLTSVPGFRTDAQVELSQPRPGPLEIQEIVMSVQS